MSAVNSFHMKILDRVQQEECCFLIHIIQKKRGKRCVLCTRIYDVRKVKLEEYVTDYYMPASCQRCSGAGTYLMSGDAHRSEGWVPCDHSYWKLVKKPVYRVRCKPID